MSRRKPYLLLEIYSHAMELLTHPAFRRHPVKTSIRAATWPIHCLIGRPLTIRYRQPDFLVKIPARFRSSGGTAAFVLREDFYPEYRVVLQMLEPEMVFFDVGANAGSFSFAASKRVGPQGRVLAFEPGPTCYELLCENVRLNNALNVQVFNQALSNEPGEARLYKHDGKENSFGLGESAEEEEVPSIPVRLTTLAIICEQEKIARLDMLKLDVEGAQQLVLEGGFELIKKHKPSLMITNNIAACRRLKLEPSAVFDMLRRIGYQFCKVTKHGVVQAIDRPQDQRHVLCLPADRKALHEWRISQSPATSATTG
ncbi:MAG: FkbM family methyltransferase [Pirellulaceae bacterium]